MTTTHTTSESRRAADEEIQEIMELYPLLTYAGWKTNLMTPEQFAEERLSLQRAQAEIELCRRVFRDARFLRGRRGKVHTAYHLKHVAETWDFSGCSYGPKRSMPPIYNGLYVSQGSAAAAALLEGFDVRPVASDSVSSVIRVKKRCGVFP